MKTRMLETSLMAYFEILPTLGERQREVLAVFAQNPAMDFTNMEMAEELGWSINRVTPRVYELRGEGKNNPIAGNPILVESRRRRCKVTRWWAWAWQLSPNYRRAKHKTQS